MSNPRRVSEPRIQEEDVKKIKNYHDEQASSYFCACLIVIAVTSVMGFVFDRHVFASLACFALCTYGVVRGAYHLRMDGMCERYLILPPGPLKDKVGEELFTNPF